MTFVQKVLICDPLYLGAIAYGRCHLHPQGYIAVWPVESQPTFWRNMSPTSSGFNSRQNKRLGWNRQPIPVSSTLKIEDARSIEMLFKFQQGTCYYRRKHTHAHSIRLFVITHPKLNFAECRSENWSHRSRALEIVNDMNQIWVIDPEKAVL
jgi:hypothetical protein